MARSCGCIGLGCLAGVLAVGNCTLSSPPTFATCPISQYSITNYRRAPFSNCALDHFRLVPDSGSGVWPYREYVSSDARPPQLQINRTEKLLSPGLIFITPAEFNQNVGAELPAAFILAEDGDLVWSSGTGSPGQMIANFRSQVLGDGQSAVTFWNGTSAGTHGYGTVEVLNDKYEKIYSVCPKLNITTPPGSNVECFVDQHEAIITADNTMLVTVYNTTVADLSPIDGPDEAFVLDSLVVEVDMDTNEPLFIWSPLQRVSVRDSRLSLGEAGLNMSKPFDFFHANAIQPWKDGYLINSRHTWTAYYVSRSGAIQWRIEGINGGDFGALPEGGHFSWQHDARLYEQSENQLELTMFANNEESDYHAAKTSVALSLLLELPPIKAEPVVLLKNLSDPLDPISTRAGGSNALLPNGNHFVGYGKHPILKEFGPVPQDGADVRWSAQFSYNVESYRAYKQDWHATPSALVALVLQRVDSGNDRLSGCAGASAWRGFISWNGATDVIQYAVYTDLGDGAMTKAFTVPKLGFETQFVIPEDAIRVQIAAIECAGKGEVGRSRVVWTHPKAQRQHSISVP